jgi:hypothetical protein
VQGLLEFLKTLGAPRIAATVAVTVALVGFFAFLIRRVTAPQMILLFSELVILLFSELAFEDSAAVVKELDRQAVPYELRNEGTIVLVIPPTKKFLIGHSGAVQRTEPGIHNHRSGRPTLRESDLGIPWLWIPAVASLGRNDGLGARS